jgi:hypothetical protein
MSDHDHDLVLRRLRGLAVLQSDSTRAGHTRRRCHAALAAPQPHGGNARARSDFAAVVLGGLVTTAAGLLVGMMRDAMRVYLRL